MAQQAEVRRRRSCRVADDAELLVNGIELCAAVHADVTAHAIRVGRAISAAARVVAVRAREVMHAALNREHRLGVRAGGGGEARCDVAIPAAGRK